MKKLLWIAMVLMGTSVTAAPIETWSGTGPNACMGRCSQEWAETQLTPEELTELREAQQNQPEPRLIRIDDGDVFRLASYYKDNAPIAYRTTTVAVLSESTTSEGWHMDGWSFVKLHDCTNWTIVEHTDIQGNPNTITKRPVIGGRMTQTKIPDQSKPPKIPWPTDDPHDPMQPIIPGLLITDDPVETPVTVVVGEPVPTPLPMSAPLLLCAVGGLLWMRK